MVKRGRKGAKPKSKPKKLVEKLEEKVEETQQEQLDYEDYCFVCKDGGLLIVCDYKGCVKAYHPHCVGKEESTEEAEDEWTCDWHNCLLCKKSSRYQCLCCPNAVCQSCFKDAQFARVRGCKGFCNDCLNLALLGDEGMDVDSDGEKVDFKDRETYEGLFKEYWDIIKEKEGFTLEDLHYADVQLKKGEKGRSYFRRKGENVRPQPEESSSDAEDFKKEEESKEDSSDNHESDDGIEPEPIVMKPTKRPKKVDKRLKVSKRIEYVGWASKSLIQFLGSIGVDTSKKQSQDDVVLLINKYVQENKLFNPEKKKMVLCDVRLRSLLGRKSISIYKITDALEAHFADNIEQSDDEGYSSGYEENNNEPLPAKKQAWWRNPGSFQVKGSLMEKFQHKEAISEVPPIKESVVQVQYSPFATIIPKNLKLIYLKKSLVEQLLDQLETFESKVVGSFVKVKSDPFDVKHPYLLLPVTGILKTSDEDSRKILLQVCTLPNDVPISKLSNDDITEEDCEDLRKKIDDDLVEKLIVVEVEKKAKCLHEDITKHWIAKELSVLRYRIDLANEKGRRAELYEYRRRRDLLQSEEELARLLNEAPQVIADVIEVEPATKEAQGTDDSPGKNDSVVKDPDEKSEEIKITA